MYGHKLSTNALPFALLLASVIYIVVKDTTISLCTTVFLLALLRYFRLPRNDVGRPNDGEGHHSRVLSSKENLIIGHRGAGLDAPENTLAAIRLAKECGADGVEVDMELTSDGIAVLMHDDTVDRTTDGHGPITAMSLSEVRKLNAAHYYQGNKYTLEKIPTLEEAVQECIKLELLLFIDVKGRAKESTRVLKDLFKRHPQLYKYGVVSSFYPTVIYQMKQADFSIPTSLAYHSNLLTRRTDGVTRNKEWWKQLLAPTADIVYEWALYSWMHYLCGISFLVVYRDMVSRDFVKYWQDRNIRVLAWGVNTDHEKGYFRENLCVSYMTDSFEPAKTRS